MITARIISVISGIVFIARVGNAAVMPLPQYADSTGRPSQQFVALPVLPEGMLQRDQETEAAGGGRLLRVGLNRLIETPAGLVQPQGDGQWQVHEGGWKSFATSIASPGALGLRLHLVSLRLENGARLLVYDPAAASNAPLTIEAGDIPLTRELWTGTQFTDRVVVEAQLPPGVEAGAVEFQVAELSHLYDSPGRGMRKLAGSCQRDVACHPDYRREASGVARMAFIDQGNTYVCTGALLAGGKGGNFFLTAHHCIRNQSLASTIELFWFFEANGCGGEPPDLDEVPVTRGGAELLTSAEVTDAAFLRLRQKPPGGATPLQWSTTAPAINDSVLCIHHPEGTQKRLSRGRLMGIDPAFWGVQWTSGTTEDGSSGSPLLNARGQVIGQLDGGYHGPGSSCANPGAPDQFGRFDLTYQAIQHWLTGKSSEGAFGGANATYSGLVYDSSAGPSPETSGFFTLRTTSKGKVTGKLMIRGVSAGFSGTIDPSGQASLTINSRVSRPLSLHLQFNRDDLSYVEGTLTDGSFTSQIYGGIAGAPGSLGSAPGQYTVVIPGGSTTGAPGGDSYGTLTVDSRGKTRFTGSLADGTKVSQSAAVVNGQLPLSASLYRGQGLLIGWINFAETGAYDLAGDVTWISPAYSGKNFYTGGFALDSRASGARLERTSNMAGFSEGMLTLEAAGSGENVSLPVAVDSRGRIVADPAAKLKLSVASNGMFRGSVLDPASGRPIPFGGVIFQREQLGAGYFLRDRQSGRVFLNGYD